MLLDWDNPPELDVPRRRWVRQLIADRMKLVHLQQSRAKGAKKHSTNKERSHLERAKARKIKHDHSAHLRLLAKYHEAVRAFWNGERDTYPRPKY